MVKRILPLTLALLAGCALAPPATPTVQPIAVKVPVAVPVYCTIPKLARPELPISQLKPQSPPAQTIRAYAASVVLLKGAVIERDAVIAGCARPPLKPSAATAAPKPGNVN